ncbi:hypothetical protein BGP_2568 [Beggiatoa sp. PS]|nr:hypothetical protein BGP_2568 [Beggiatoa sp. PS]
MPWIFSIQTRKPSAIGSCVALSKMPPHQSVQSPDPLYLIE